MKTTRKCRASRAEHESAIVYIISFLIFKL